MSKEVNKYDIEGRLIDFVIRTIKLAGSLPKAGSHIAKDSSEWNCSGAQLWRSIRSEISICFYSQNEDKLKRIARNKGMVENNH